MVRFPWLDGWNFFVLFSACRLYMLHHWTNAPEQGSFIFLFYTQLTGAFNELWENPVFSGWGMMGIPRNRTEQIVCFCLFVCFFFSNCSFWCLSELNVNIDLKLWMKTGGVSGADLVKFSGFFNVSSFSLLETNSWSAFLGFHITPLTSWL